MKVLIINQHPSDGLGGSEMQCDLIACGLSNRGHQVIYGAVGNNRKDHYPGLLYTVIPFAFEKRGELFSLLRKEKPDVVYWRVSKLFLLQEVKECKQANIPFVFAVSNPYDVEKLVFTPPKFESGIVNNIKYYYETTSSQIKSRWNYHAFKHIDALTTLNSQLLGKVPVKKQRTIWNSVSEKISPFKWERPYVVWVSNIKPTKQPEIFIKIASLLGEKLPSLDFLMIGAIQKDFYKPIITEAEKMNNFYYLGFQPPEIVNGVLANAICSVHTCKPEGFGNNFIQAWMQGCPTITLEHDPEDIIRNEQLGFISGNIEKMCDDIELVLNDKELRNEISSRAQAFARANFTVERMTLEVESFLCEVVNEYNP